MAVHTVRGTVFTPAQEQRSGDKSKEREKGLYQNEGQKGRRERIYENEKVKGGDYFNMNEVEEDGVYHMLGEIGVSEARADEGLAYEVPIQNHHLKNGNEEYQNTVVKANVETTYSKLQYT